MNFKLDSKIIFVNYITRKSTANVVILVCKNPKTWLADEVGRNSGCKLYLVYNGPSGRKACVYFYLIQQETNGCDRGRFFFFLLRNHQRRCIFNLEHTRLRKRKQTRHFGHKNSLQNTPNSESCVIKFKNIGKNKAVSVGDLKSQVIN